MKKWNSIKPPERLLIIRLQATGDMVATLPFAQSLRERLPAGTIIDFLTREECCSIPESLELFNEVQVLKGGRDSKKQLLHLMLLLPKLRKKKYSAVLDLQNNRISRYCRKMLNPAAWVEFDKFSPVHGCERYKNTINSSGITDVELCTSFKIKNTFSALTLLKSHGWNGSDKLIVINPAGAFITRNWTLENYVQLCRDWTATVQGPYKFLVLGLSTISNKAEYLKRELGDMLIDLTSRTSPAEAFAIIQETSLVISEDSGLMHMAYLSGIPTVGLLGSTRNDWTDPCLPHTRFFHSGDLACGNCMKADCLHGDVRCLTRVSPLMVLEKARELLGK